MSSSPTPAQVPCGSSCRRTLHIAATHHIHRLDVTAKNSSGMTNDSASSLAKHLALTTEYCPSWSARLRHGPLCMLGRRLALVAATRRHRAATRCRHARSVLPLLLSSPQSCRLTKATQAISSDKHTVGFEPASAKITTITKTRSQKSNEEVGINTSRCKESCCTAGTSGKHSSRRQASRQARRRENQSVN